MAVSKQVRERRWLVVAEDGRHVTLGRHSDPSDDEIAEAGRRIDALGLAAWLVISEGGYYNRTKVTLMMVRSITAAQGDWVAAETRWQEHRKAALGGFGSTR
jgi:hypothetical protein